MRRASRINRSRTSGGARLRVAREFVARNEIAVTFKADAAAALASDVLTLRVGWRDVAVYLRGSSR